MGPKNKLRVYLTYDTDDSELVNLLVDALKHTEVFDVFISPFESPETIPSFDSARRVQIENCDFMIALFTRRSPRWILIEKEVELAKKMDKVLFPMLDLSVKIPRIGTLLFPYREIPFNRKDILKALNLILERLKYLCARLGVSEDLVIEAELAIKTFFEQPSLEALSKSKRLAIFQEIVVETLKVLDYSVKEPQYYGDLATREREKGFALKVVKNGRATHVNCILHPATRHDVRRTASAHESSVSDVWLVCTGVTSNVQSMTVVERAGVNIVPIQALLEWVNPLDKKRLSGKLAQLLRVETRSVKYCQLLSKLRSLMRDARSALTPYRKGMLLERLAESFVELFPGLESVGKNVRIEAEELDLVVKNENEKIFWQRIGSPIIIECKNWTKPVGASEVRDLIQKMREVRTAFLIAAKGVTSKDGAYYEIIEARKKEKFILVFDSRDIDNITNGADPELVVREKFYSLWTH